MDAFSPLTACVEPSYFPWRGWDDFRLRASSLSYRPSVESVTVSCSSFLCSPQGSHGNAEADKTMMNRH